MNETPKLLCYFESLLVGQMQPHEGFQSIHLALKLWGELYVRFPSFREFEKAVLDSIERRETVIIVVDNLKPEVLQLLEVRGLRAEVLLVTWENQPQLGVEPQRILGLVNHFLSVSQPHLTTTALISAIKKTTGRDIFGIDKYLMYGTPVRSFALSRSAERGWFVDSLMEYVSNLDGLIASGAQEFARMAGEVLDEFLMNAIWDANPMRCEQDRDIPVFLKPNEIVKVEWGLDGSLLALGVNDPFGTLRKTTLSHYVEVLLNGKSHKEIKVNRTGPGAGVGLHMVLRRVSGLVINISPGISTEFIALLDITRSARFLSKGPRTFHFFTL